MPSEGVFRPAAGASVRAPSRGLETSLMNTAPKFSRLDPGSGANRSSTPPTRCSPSAAYDEVSVEDIATRRRRHARARAPLLRRPQGGLHRGCSSGSARVREERTTAARRPQRPRARGRQRVALARLDRGRTARSGSPRSAAAKTSPTPTSGTSSPTSCAAPSRCSPTYHADIADDSPRLRYALECWTGLNRAATRRWLQGEATRDATHELLASTLEHVLRTFGAPPRAEPASQVVPQTRNRSHLL